jgi:hypothetical protein
MNHAVFRVTEKRIFRPAGESSAAQADSRPPVDVEVSPGNKVTLRFNNRDYGVDIVSVSPTATELRTVTLSARGQNAAIVNPNGEAALLKLALNETATFETPFGDQQCLWQMTLVKLLSDEPAAQPPVETIKPLPDNPTPKNPEPPPVPVSSSPVASRPAPIPALPPIGKPVTPSSTPANPLPPSAVPSAPPPKAGLKFRIPNINWKEAQNIISQMQSRTGGPVLCYFVSANASITQNHPDLFIDHLRKFSTDDQLSLVVISSGGIGEASLRIATIIREYFKKFTLYVPSRCASAATMLALSADRIVMTVAGYLTAIDSTVYGPLNPKGADGKTVGVSVDQVNRVLHFLEKEGPARGEGGLTEGAFRTLFHYLHPLALGEIQRNSSESELIARKMMLMHPQSFANPGTIDLIARKLVNDYPAHSFPILFDEAKSLGLPVEKADREISDLLRDLHKFYEQSARPTITNTSPDFYHVEEFPVVIESVDRRTAYRYSFDKRLNSLTKLWSVENDNSQWLNLRPGTPPDQEFVMTPIDVPDVTEPSAAPAPAEVNTD